MRLLKHLDHKRIAFDVEDELRFHMEMLERKYTQHGMSSAEATAAARKRFGNFEKVKSQCVQISRRNSPLQYVLKGSLIMVGFSGVLIKILSSDYKIARIGTVLVSIAIFGRLLIYVRGLSPSTFLPRTKEVSLSISRKP